MLPSYTDNIITLDCSHNIVGKRTSQFEYFGPASKDFNPSDFYGLADYRSDAIEVCYHWCTGN